MFRLIVRWIVSALGILVISYLPGISVDRVSTLFVAAVVLGLLNTLVRPILFWLTLPVTILTLGLFYFVLNGAMLMLASWLVSGFRVAGLVHAVIGALVLSLFSILTGWIGRKEEKSS